MGEHETDPTAIDATQAELAAVRRERDEYVSSICFETTCTNCAHMLNMLAASQELEDNDQIEAAKSRRIRTQQESIRGLREDRNHYRALVEATRAYVDDPGNWSAIDGRRQRLLELLGGAR